MVQNWKAGLWFGYSWKAFSKGTSPERQVTGFTREQEDDVRCARAKSKESRLQWEILEKWRITWQELWALDAGHITFLLEATYDVLPKSQNIAHWVSEDPNCKLCAGGGILKHIMYVRKGQDSGK